jgi:hypothetical protein
MDSEDDEGAGSSGQPAKPDRIRQYPVNYFGPFVVFIRQADTPLQHLVISKEINEQYMGVVKSLVKVNSAKIKVEFKDRASANGLPSAKFLNKYRVYIPAESVEISGLISISTDTKAEEIVENAVGKFVNPESAGVKVVDAYRFTRPEISSSGGSNERRPTSVVRVTFEGTLLPKWVVIHGLLIPVRFHTPRLMHCDNCLGYGHTARYCDSKHICKKCGDRHLTDSCGSVPHICVHCKKNVDHSRKEDCPIYRQHFNRLREKTLSRARNGMIVTQTNRYSLLSENNVGDSAGLLGSSIGGWSQVEPPSRKRTRLTDESLGGSTSASPTLGRQVGRGGGSPSAGGGFPVSFAEVVAGRGRPDQISQVSGPKKRSRRRSKSTSGEVQGRDLGGQSSSGGSLGGDNGRTANGDDTLRKSLKDALNARMASFSLHPLMLSIFSTFVSPIVDWLWPMISSFVPLLLPILNRNGQC